MIGRMAKTLASLFALALVGVVDAAGQEQQGLPELNREAVRSIVADARRIVDGRGVEELKEVEIGGIKQWISVRGRDRRNPILLFVHGGPGSTEMPVSWFYQSPLEDYFTVVQWDQRGSGKTARSSEPADVVPTITVERMVADGEELVAHLRDAYDKEKLFVLGHSWGTVIGLEIARRHPGWLHAYIGMGQFVYAQGNERVGYEFALNEAKARNDDQAISELEAIAPYPKPDGSLDVREILTQRKWVIAYGGLTWGRDNFRYDENLRLLSPDYADSDILAGQNVGTVLVQLLPQLTVLDFWDVKRLHCPIFLFSGRYDYQTPSQVSADWFKTLEAPEKKIFWFEHSAHMMQMEQPGKFFLHLVNDIRPLAEQTGDAAPEDSPGVGQ